jgi:hypothetical protein
MDPCRELSEKKTKLLGWVFNDELWRSRRQTPDEWDQTIVGWQLEDFHLHLPQFITTFSTQNKKRAFDSFVKTFAIFLTTNNQTNPQTSARSNLSLSPLHVQQQTSTLAFVHDRKSWMIPPPFLGIRAFVYPDRPALAASSISSSRSD